LRRRTAATTRLSASASTPTPAISHDAKPKPAFTAVVIVDVVVVVGVVGAIDSRPRSCTAVYAARMSLTRTQRDPSV
jgi:hypothetical protein